ncbi:DUF3187 family protein [Mangrovimicrobium sediminis]|uniref:DUF3187 family protein n=1 Tax=Mangrovimicrobium sediminis TaxID=2562682 RepID=A0A4Z0M353_9GAMM|nr:DUF3187 family protein [Haliea sp. SAOS-164]TGD73886.1 DUF3187 family protein [Haliea sp. SAOS-164]
MAVRAAARYLALGVLLAATQPLLAGEALYIRNTGPVAGLFGLPALRGDTRAAAGHWQLALHGSLASHYVSEERGDELLNFDGETGRLALEWRFGLAPDWEIQLELPWLRHSGGHLDGPIEQWHQLWNNTDGGRSRVADDQLSYGYRSDPFSATDDFLLQDERSGFGDPSLALSHRFYHGERSALSLSLGYKFGVADAQQFLGSGADDAWLALRGSAAVTDSFDLYGQFGLLHAGRGDLLPEVQERDLWFAGLGMDWWFVRHWALLLQLDAHAAPADSAIKGLGEDALLGSAGLRWRADARWEVELAIAEDLATETAPDVTLLASFRYRPAARP